MELQEDVIAAISPAREKFFGCSGKMLLPSPKTVAAFIQKMPARKLISTDVLRKKLAEQFEVEATCPVALRQALQAIAKDASQITAYWRVVKKNGELIATYPGGLNAHATLLKKDGFAIDRTGKAPKVKHFADQASQ
jgi:6-O-methylguanine DNA methyltransferase, DNA binding domain